MATIIKAPAHFDDLSPSVFLAGSIEMGAAENWQEHITRLLADTDITILNPRRDDWDSSWVQSIHNPQFRQQVEWELSAMEHADVIVMHFEPNTKSPITLLEFGLFARSGKLIVHCPDGFWRKGNVEVVAARYGVPLVSSIDELARAVILRLTPRAADWRPRFARLASR